jgi:DNA polymerase III epsilon subunit-like protein
MAYCYCIFDTETNGLPNKNDFSNVYIIQIAIVITDGKQNFIEKEYLVKGDFVISNEITKLTGITKEMTELFGETFEYIWNDMNNILEQFSCTFHISHNNYFDLNMIKQEYKRLKQLKQLTSQEYFLIQDDTTLIVQKINQYNIINKQLIHKYRYKSQLLLVILNKLENKTIQTEIDIFHLIKNFNQNKKFYNEPFFQLIPFCSLIIFKKKIQKSCVENYKLQTIYNFLHKEPYVQQHTALDDCFILQKCLNEINFNIKENILE